MRRAAASATKRSVAERSIGPPAPGCALAQSNTTRMVSTPDACIRWNSGAAGTSPSISGPSATTPKNPFGTSRAALAEAAPGMRATMSASNAAGAAVRRDTRRSLRGASPSARRLPAAMPRSYAIAAAGILALAAALRFATLGAQSFWLDEAVTAQVVTRDLGGVFSSVWHGESTPPLYYVLAWLWVKPFGNGEVGLRALSAFLGTLTVAVAFGLGGRMGGRRAALLAGLLA